MTVGMDPCPAGADGAPPVRPPMLRALILTSRFPDRGRPNLGNFVERQLLELVARGHVQCEVVAPIGGPADPFGSAGTRRADDISEAESWKGLAVHRLPYPRAPGLSFLRPHALAQRLLPQAVAIRRHFAVDLISAEFAWPDGPAAAAVGKAIGVPVLIKARGMDFERRAESDSMRRRLVRAGCSAAGLLAVSESVKQAMVATGLPAERISVHYPAVDAEIFKPGDRDAAKARLGVSGPLLVAVGNLILEKGHALAVEALALLDDATLIIAGGGAERSALLARAARLGVSKRLRLLGSVPHALLPQLFTAADVTLHPSLVEGFGNVRLESLACGTPLVTTRAGDASLMVDGEAAGRVVDPTPQAIAEAVRSLLERPPSPEAVRARIADFTWARQSGELERHFFAAAGLELPPHRGEVNVAG